MPIKVYRDIQLMDGVEIIEENDDAPPESTMPVMTGITGYFIPETQDVSNQRWLDYLGGNSIKLVNAIQTNKAIELRAIPWGYGKYYTEEPLIIYAIIKFATASSGVKCALTKALTGAGYSKGFNILGFNTAFGFSAGSNEAHIESDGLNYHTMCIVRNGHNDPVQTYANGNYVTQSNNVSMIDYSGYFLLNDEEFGTIRYDPPHNFDYVMLAFGQIPHSAEEIKQNQEWLEKKYLQENEEKKGIKVYHDILMMNDTKIYLPDGTEYEISET